jgi:hypothetical protein
MRLKQFLIFIVIFTVSYTLFFAVFDYIVSLIEWKKELKHARMSVNTDDYRNFARFYGLVPEANKSLIMKIYNHYDDRREHKISLEAEHYNLSNVEYIVIILYLEYLDLLERETIYLNRDTISVPTYRDEEIFTKYIVYLHEKKSLEEMTNLIGFSTKADLTYLDSVFLIPGVRFINSQLYYYGAV